MKNSFLFFFLQLTMCGLLATVSSGCDSDHADDFSDLVLPADFYTAENPSLNSSDVYAAYTDDVVDGWQVKRDAQDFVVAVNFANNPAQTPPQTADEFFRQFLGEEAAASFQLEESGVYGKTGRLEHYHQYCNGVKVDEGYHFHYENGVMVSANGTYVPLEGFDAVPTFNSHTARRYAALFNHFSSIKATEENVTLRIGLIPIGNAFQPRLLYDVTHSKSPKDYSPEIYYTHVDAHTGRIVYQSAVY